MMLPVYGSQYGLKSLNFDILITGKAATRPRGHRKMQLVGCKLPSAYLSPQVSTNIKQISRAFFLLFYNWLVSTPPKNLKVTWGFFPNISQYMEKYKMFQTTNQNNIGFPESPKRSESKIRR